MVHGSSVPRAFHDGQSRIAGEAPVGLRQFAHDEDAAAVARDRAGVPAGRAETHDDVLPGLGPIVHHDEVFTSEAITRDIRVSVVAQYAPDRSRPTQQQWFFLYTITIANNGSETVQLLTRHWIITDGGGQVEEVRGPGVVGEQPVLGPGESFTYTSGCPLPTPFGMMEGTYQMVTKDGEFFDVQIAPFTLSEPYTVH